jgi:hypothetical protein
MREYSFIKDTKNGCFYLVQTQHRHVAVWGIGGTPDRKSALKQAKNYCKNSIAKLHIEG